MWNKQPSPGLQEAQETGTNFLPDPGGWELGGGRGIARPSKRTPVAWEDSEDCEEPSCTTRCL